jgi:hypothetical protein
VLSYYYTNRRAKVTPSQVRKMKDKWESRARTPKGFIMPRHGNTEQVLFHHSRGTARPSQIRNQRFKIRYYMPLLLSFTRNTVTFTNSISRVKWKRVEKVICMYNIYYSMPFSYGMCERHSTHSATDHRPPTCLFHSRGTANRSLPLCTYVEDCMPRTKLCLSLLML